MTHVCHLAYPFSTCFELYTLSCVHTRWSKATYVCHLLFGTSCIEIPIDWNHSQQALAVYHNWLIELFITKSISIKTYILVYEHNNLCMNTTIYAYFVFISKNHHYFLKVVRNTNTSLNHIFVGKFILTCALSIGFDDRHELLLIWIPIMKMLICCARWKHLRDEAKLMTLDFFANQNIPKHSTPLK